jgi:hypothetical protein
MKGANQQACLPSQLSATLANTTLRCQCCWASLDPRHSCINSSSTPMPDNRTQTAHSQGTADQARKTSLAAVHKCKHTSAIRSTAIPIRQSLLSQERGVQCPPPPSRCQSQPQQPHVSRQVYMCFVCYTSAGAHHVDGYRVRFEPIYA